MKKLRYGILSTASIVPRFLSAIRMANNSVAMANNSIAMANNSIAMANNSVAMANNSIAMAIASRTPEKAEEFAARYEIPLSFGSYEECIKSPEVDILYIAMVNSEHYRYARMALEAGKHVLCEKPMTITEEEARELFHISRINQCFLMEAQKVVFLPVIQKVKEIISSGALGKIQMIDCSSSYDVTGYGWYYDAELGGGILYGNALYSMHMAQYLLNSPITNYGGVCTKSHTNIESQFGTVMNLQNGSILVNKSSTLTKTPNTAVLYGEKGMVEIPDYWKCQKAMIRRTAGDTEIIEYPCEHELIYEILHTQDCIQKGLLESPIMNEAVTVRSISILSDLNRQWFYTIK